MMHNYSKFAAFTVVIFNLALFDAALFNVELFQNCAI